MKHLIEDALGALSLFAIGYGSLWLLPLLSEVLQ